MSWSSPASVRTIGPSCTPAVTTAGSIATDAGGRLLDEATFGIDGSRSRCLTATLLRQQFDARTAGRSELLRRRREAGPPQERLRRPAMDLRPARQGRRVGPAPGWTTNRSTDPTATRWTTEYDERGNPVREAYQG